MAEKITTEHVEKHTLHEVSITPAHGKRDTFHFSKSVQKLKNDGHYSCFVCGKKDNLQVHHFVEFSFENVVDFDKLKELLLIFDFYGYSQALKNEPITSIDDVRNMLVLCQEHHTGVDHEDGGSGIGVHETTCPDWIIQKVCKDGKNPIPQKGETVETVEERIAS